MGPAAPAARRSESSAIQVYLGTSGGRIRSRRTMTPPQMTKIMPRMIAVKRRNRDRVVTEAARGGLPARGAFLLPGFKRSGVDDMMQWISRQVDRPGRVMA